MNGVWFGLNQQTKKTKTFAKRCMGRRGAGSLIYWSDDWPEKNKPSLQAYIQYQSQKSPKYQKNMEPVLNYNWIIT